MKNKKISLFAFILAFTANAFGQGIIADRTSLNALLDAQKSDEGFELYGQPDSSAVIRGGILSATNNWGSSPGSSVIISGLTISSTYADAESSDFWVQWNGNNFHGTTSRTVMTSYGLRLDFWNPTLAFGLDVKDFPTDRRVFTYGITVFAADDSTILYENNAFDMTEPGNGVFFGFQNPGGIGSVILSTTSGSDPLEFGYLSSPQIDNLSFSTAPIPEPSTIAIGLLGLSALALRWRKR